MPGEEAVPNQPRPNWRRPAHAMKKRSPKRPDDPEALNNLGLVLERSGQIDEAIARFSRAAQLGPRNWAYHFSLAHALAQRQTWDRAVSEYRIAAGLYPTDAATQCNLATALQKTRQC